MEIENDLLELDEERMDELTSLESKFDYFLKERDLLYEKRLSFDVVYSHKKKKYEIRIRSLDKNKIPSRLFSTTFLIDVNSFCEKYNIDSLS